MTVQGTASWNSVQCRLPATRTPSNHGQRSLSEPMAPPSPFPSMGDLQQVCGPTYPSRRDETDKASAEAVSAAAVAELNAGAESGVGWQLAGN